MQLRAWFPPPPPPPPRYLGESPRPRGWYYLDADGAATAHGVNHHLPRLDSRKPNGGETGPSNFRILSTYV